MVAGEEGRHGPASLCSGSLHPEVIDYLQNCPSWLILTADAVDRDLEPSRCISEAEGKLRLEREFVSHVSEKAPKCRSLNACAELQPITAVRVGCFARALRKRARGWLQQLQARLRSEIRREGLPVDCMSNASPSLEEELPDNAFAYASLQICQIGERQDGWHTDGGASLLHAGLTIFGSRTLCVKLQPKTGGFPDRQLHLPQRPGSFYLGNMCTLEHNVVHGATSPGSWEDRLQMMVMLRPDLFHDSRAHVVNSCPGPRELFRIVNRETARHLAEIRFPLPDLADVLAESG